MFSTQKMGTLVAAFALCLGLGFAKPAHADLSLTGEKWVDVIKFSGDIRQRHESFFYKQAGQRDSNRERFRLRWGVTATIQDFTAGFRIASGAGQQVSTNQNESNLFSGKGLWLDQAYLQWKAREYLKFTVGKMPNPLWRTYASDLVWDEDVTPEGYAESYDSAIGDRLGVFATLGQFPLLSASQTQADPWMYANQIGGRIKVNEDTKVTIAGTYYGFSNEKVADFTGNSATPAGALGSNTAVAQQGNARVAGSNRLATSLQLMHFTGEVSTHLLVLPVSFQGDFVHNMSDTQHVGSNGYQTGAIFGKAKDAKTWEFAYFYKYVQYNATYADIADSDFGNGGINRKGHIFWIAYSPRDYLQIKGKYFITQTLNPFLATTANAAGSVASATANNTGNNGNINRFQLDVALKF
jgi:hypothetical protein